MRRSYTTYSLGVAVVWAIVLAVGAILDRHAKFSATTFDVLLLVFGGFAIGWVSATIARFVYPPPRKWLHGNGPGTDLRPAGAAAALPVSRQDRQRSL
jgi:hypothetical protein